METMQNEPWIIDDCSEDIPEQRNLSHALAYIIITLYHLRADISAV